TVSELDKPAGNLTGKGWIVDILPQMEEQGMYDQVKAAAFSADFQCTPFNGNGIGAMAIREVIGTQRPWLSCPSDPSAIVSNQQWYWGKTGPVNTATTS